MYKEEEIEVKKFLSRIITKGNLRAENNVYIFGVNMYFPYINRVLAESGIRICAIIDNDKRKRHLLYNEIEVIDISEVKEIDNENNRFVICSTFWKEMRSQLLENKVSEGCIFPLVLHTFGESLWGNVADVIKGRRVYRKIVKHHPGCRILLCPYTGTGDIYLIGTFLALYLKKENIKNYVLVVVSNACKKVADIFLIQNIYKIAGPEECRFLSKYYLFCPQKCNVTYMNDCWGTLYTNPVQWLRGLHGMNFAEMFRRFTFRLDEGVRPEHPNFKPMEAEVLKVVSDTGMRKGKTIIVAPYATTLVGMPAGFWIELVKRLQEKGYVIYTNGMGKSEPAIEGTRQISFPLNIAPQLVEWAGGFIGIRSGLCDVVSGAEAKKVILYDRANFFYNCSAFEYFSLNKMGLSNDAVEIEFDNQQLGDCMNQILVHF